MRPLTAILPVAGKAVAVLSELRLTPAHFLEGIPYDRDQAQAVWQAQIGVPSSWAR
jgi:hypothetical protein